MKYGFATWIFPGSAMEDALDRLGRHGVEWVEYSFRNLALSSADQVLRREFSTDKNAWRVTETSIPTRRIAEKARSLGISAIQMHAPVFDLTTFDERRRSLAVEKSQVCLGICSDLEVPRMVVHPGVGDLEMGSYSGFVAKVRERNIKSLKALAATASDLGVKIVLENRGQNVYGSRAEDLLEMARASDPESVMTCLDTGHASRNDLSCAEMANVLGKSLQATHLHDNDGTGDQHLPPLCGRVDWVGFLGALRKIGYPHPPILEIRGSEDPTVGENRLLLCQLVMEEF
jgi:sugar phosphate isomerase/epimerase